MTFVVPFIVEVLMNKIALWISIRANDWSAERAIIATDELKPEQTLPKVFFGVSTEFRD